MGQQKRERKLTSPNTLLAVRRTKGPSKSREELAAQASDRPSPAGGWRQGKGKGAGSAPRTASPTTLQTGLQFLIKDLLRFRREGCGEKQGTGTRPARAVTGARDAEGRRQKAEGARTRLAWAETETGTTEERRCDEPGESAPVKLLAA